MYFLDHEPRVDYRALAIGILLEIYLHCQWRGVGNTSRLLVCQYKLINKTEFE